MEGLLMSEELLKTLDEKILDETVGEQGWKTTKKNNCKVIIFISVSGQPLIPTKIQPCPSTISH